MLVFPLVAETKLHIDTELIKLEVKMEDYYNNYFLA